MLFCSTDAFGRWHTTCQKLSDRVLRCMPELSPTYMGLLKKNKQSVMGMEMKSLHSCNLKFSTFKLNIGRSDFDIVRRTSHNFPRENKCHSHSILSKGCLRADDLISLSSANQLIKPKNYVIVHSKHFFLRNCAFVNDGDVKLSDTLRWFDKLKEKYQAPQCFYY